MLDVVGNAGTGFMGAFTDTRSDAFYRNQLRIYANGSGRTADTGLVLGVDTTSASPAAYFAPGGAHIVNQLNGPLIFGTNAAEQLRVDNSGNLGIGTTTPSKRLTVRTLNNVTGAVSSLASLGSNIVFLDAQGSNYGEKTAIAAQFATGGIPAAVVFGREGTVWGTSIGFYTHNDDSAALDQMAERLHIGPTGYVGIGVAAPAHALDVNGDVNVTGSINAKYQDVAEWVPADGGLPAGTVVIVSGSHDNTVTPSARAYDTRVAGVVSSRPGLVLGEASSNKARIAATGRVKVRVDANNGAIALGDLLVTSDKPGMAMKSEPLDLGGVKIHRPGTLIGKALQPLPSGEGEILVLLSLQ
jgi:hypothetical protein